MDLLEKLKLRARARPQRIVLPEGEDPRIIAAAARIVREGFAKPILLGRKSAIESAAASAGISPHGIESIDPAAAPAAGRYARLYHERRQARGVTLDEAQTIAAKPLYYAALAVAGGDADGSVGGATNTTPARRRSPVFS